MRRVIGLAVLCLLIVSVPAAVAKEASATGKDGATVFYREVTPQSQADCPSATGPNWESYMCAWQGDEWGGQLSYWPQGSTGCHSHAENPNLRSFWNRTPYNVRIGGWGVLGPGYGLQMPTGQVITGEICWPA